MFSLLPMHTVDLEPQRPLYHFTAQKGWLNDPNGLVFYKGEYHLFFQHNPQGTGWGNMTWGHAVSRDLVRWKQVENAIGPDALGTMFSGSAVVDRKNTSGFGVDALVLFYTAAGGTNDASKGQPFTQGLAWSADGRTFTKFDKNPILAHIEHENRDPKVIWYEPTKSWIMSLYINDDRFALFGSQDMVNWSKLSDVKMPGTSECPDFFPLPLDGNRKKSLWVFSAASGHYRVGTFDGREFHPLSEVLQSNHGPNSYAAQTFYNDPKGRRIQLAWMRGSDVSGVDWNQQMSVPRKLSLRSTALGARLFSEPVDELRSLRFRKLRREGTPSDYTYQTDSPAIEMQLELQVPRTGTVTAMFSGRRLSYDAASSTLEVNGTKTVVPAQDKKLSLSVYTDTTSIEVFAQGGLFSVPVFALADTAKPNVSLSFTGDWPKPEFSVYELKSAWTKN